MDNEKREMLLDILEELCGDEVVKEDIDINLLDEGLIDSLDYITLLIQLEDAYGISMSPTEYTREEMDTPAKIIKAVEKKLANL